MSQTPLYWIGADSHVARVVESEAFFVAESPVSRAQYIPTGSLGGANMLATKGANRLRACIGYLFIVFLCLT